MSSRKNKHQTNETKKTITRTRKYKKQELEPGILRNIKLF